MDLRKKGCWDEFYKTELENYTDHEDEGAAWFGKKLNKNIAEFIFGNISARTDGSNVKIIDVGCGNACLLISILKRLRQSSISNRVELYGIDYSLSAIKLSQSKIDDLKLSSDLKLSQCDFLNQKQVSTLKKNGGFDIVIDVGTFDAIQLLYSAEASDESIADAPLSEEHLISYVESTSCLFDKKALFILASCNYTEEELKQALSEAFDLKNISFEITGKIDTLTMSFGGKTGASVTCLLINLEKKRQE